MDKGFIEPIAGALCTVNEEMGGSPSVHRSLSTAIQAANAYQLSLNVRCFFVHRCKFSGCSVNSGGDGGGGRSSSSSGVVAIVRGGRGGRREGSIHMAVVISIRQTRFSHDYLVATIGRKDGWMDGWMDGWIDGWMDGWMDG
ncbi:hypothetical protein HZH68_014295 [Vespula germanica]|uniref:Uncharacterized protein n=1 Tax=Vespula germanica TaxID=30212 RepID=A0A834JAL1_VESGE|nr:hypothetical protein HZH68_014295 [Vespula germanica]